MTRRKSHPPVNHERWLISYADFITLLFAFFVVLFASSQADKKKQTQVAASISSAFTPLGTLQPHPETPLIGTADTSTTPKPSPAAPSNDDLARQYLTATEARLNQILAEKTSAHPPSTSITMRITHIGLVISLHEAGFFASGSADVRPAAIPLIQQIASTLPTAPIRIEGHTDNVPIHTAQFASNWELSTARASHIARIFLDRPNAIPANLSAAGYAEYHPVASNDTEAGRAQNRRIDVILLWPTETPTTPPNP